MATVLGGQCSLNKWSGRTNPYSVACRGNPTTENGVVWAILSSGNCCTGRNLFTLVLQTSQSASSFTSSKPFSHSSLHIFAPSLLSSLLPRSLVFSIWSGQSTFTQSSTSVQFVQPLPVYKNKFVLISSWQLWLRKECQKYIKQHCTKKKKKMRQRHWTILLKVHSHRVGGYRGPQL